MPDQFAMWAAVVLAAVFAAWRLWRLMAARVHVRVATELIARLVRAGNLDRARKLCAAAPRSVYLVAVRAALAEPLEARARFTDAFGRAMAPLESHRWMDLTALAAALVAVVIAATTTTPSRAGLLLGAGAALAALFNLQTMRRLRRRPPLAFAAIADALAAVQPDTSQPAARASEPAPPPREPPAARASSLDLRNGCCPLCGGSDIAERPAVGGDLVPWVCRGCGYAQLFAAR